jgi:MFS transporter, DHA1 family, inner membrane transport protein
MQDALLITSPAAQEQELSRWSQRLVLFWTGFSCACFSIVKPLLVGALIDGYHLTARQAGFVAGIEMAGVGLAAIITSAFGANWGRHALIRFGAIIGVIGSLTPLASQSVPALLVLRLTAGMGSGFIAAVVISTIGRSGQPERLFGLYFIVSFVLATGFVPLEAVIIRHYGPDGAYYSFVVLLLAVLALIRFTPNAHLARRSAAGHLPPFPLASALMTLGVSILYWIGSGALWSFTERLGLQSGASGAQVAAALSIGQLASIGGAATAAALGTRLGRVAPAYASIAISIGGLALIGGSGFSSYAAGTLLFSFAWTLFLTYLNGLLSAQDSAGRVVALGVSSQTLGMAIGPSVAGALVAPFGYQAIVTFGIGCDVAAAMLLTVLALSPTLLRQRLQLQ